MRILLAAILLMAATSYAQTDVYVEGGLLHGGPDGQNTRAYGAGFIADQGKHIGLGLRYINEGHPGKDYARDGFAGQVWYTQPISRNLDVQVGTGPYASMNNTTVNGVRENDFRVGLLSSVALKWYPTSTSWYLAAEYNNALVPGAAMSNSVMLRVGNDFQHRLLEPTKFDLSAWVGYSRTTQIGEQGTATAFELEAKRQFSEHLSYSASLLAEGNTMLQDRVGVTGKLWYDSKLNDRWTIGAGAGPYLYHDGVSGTQGIAAVISFRGMYSVTKNWSGGLTYTRVASFSNRDEDVVALGVMRHF